MLSPSITAICLLILLEKSKMERLSMVECIPQRGKERIGDAGIVSASGEFFYLTCIIIETVREFSKFSVYIGRLNKGFVCFVF